MVKNIAVIGDALIDVWVYGTLATSQDGCNKFVEERRLITPGGAALAASFLPNVTLFAQKLRGTKTRFLCNDTIVFRHDRERFCKPIESLDISRFDAILLCDYDKGFLSPKFIQQVIADVKRLNIPCVADVKRKPQLYEGAIRKGNLDYYNKYGPIEVVTRGADAPLVYGEELEVSSNVDCINHVGAGDCFAAMLTMFLAKGSALQEAAKNAYMIASDYITRDPRGVIYGKRNDDGKCERKPQS